MMSREASQRTYPQIGVREPHHTLSHHGNDPRKMESNAKINVFHVEQFVKFLNKLDATPDGNGSLLDHSLVFYGSGMGDGNAHATDPLPVEALEGYRSGRLTGYLVQELLGFETSMEVDAFLNLQTVPLELTLTDLEVATKDKLVVSVQWPQAQRGKLIRKLPGGWAVTEGRGSLGVRPHQTANY